MLLMDLTTAVITMYIEYANHFYLHYLFSVDNQVYTLAAQDNSAAMNWIEKLQVLTNFAC